MKLLKMSGLLLACWRVAGLTAFVVFAGVNARSADTVQALQAPAQSPAAARPVGTVKSIAGSTITLSTDAGSEVTVQVQDGAKLVRVAPGKKDLMDAAAIQLQDLQQGDRIIVRGKLSDDGKTVLASGVIVMSKTDIAAKQARERQEWQRNGVGGLVETIDTGTGTITIATPSLGEKKSVTVHFAKDTVVRRYAPDSVKFDDAKPAPVEQIKPGDQLRARGTRNAVGTELAADEIVAGTFRNIAGTISSMDTGAGTLTLQDLASRKTFTVKVTMESQLRKLPAQMAQRIAARLKGAPPDVVPSGAAGARVPHVNAAATKQPVDPTAAPGNGGAGRPAGGGDMQQSILRLPPAVLGDLQKGDAVMIVATEGAPSGVVTAITLLGGVEPILQDSPKGGPSTILSPWSLGGAPGGDAGTP